MGRQQGHMDGPIEWPQPQIWDEAIPLSFPLMPWDPPNETRGKPMLYRPFSTSHLYNWRTQHAKFSDNPKDLILFTHQPPGMTASSSCRFSLPLRKESESRWKSVLGDDRQPTQNPDLINAAFPLSRPAWDYNSAEGKERLRVYRQPLMGGLEAATREPPI